MKLPKSRPILDSPDQSSSDLTVPMLDRTVPNQLRDEQ